MRDLDAGIEALENRLERDEHPLLLIIWQAKRDALATIKNGEATTEEMDRTLEQVLVQNDGVPFQAYLQVQAGRNAAAWAEGELDSI